MVASETFRNLTRDFIVDFTNYGYYHNNKEVRDNSQAFIDDISNSDQEEESMNIIYKNYGLDFDSSMFLKNKIDNDLLQILHEFPELIDQEDSVAEKNIITAMEIGIRSKQGIWEGIGEEVIRDIKTNGNPELTIDEVWDCLKGAVGIGGESIIGIGGLKALAKDGIQAAVVSVSKFLAKKAEWIGVAITVIDFSSYIYKEAND